MSDEAMDAEDGKCMQPSCTSDATMRCRIKTLYSARGEKLAPEENDCAYFREFFAEHSTRGNGSREDCDDNYEKQPINANT